MRIVVVGAGVGGLAVARGLHSFGHEIEVLERGRELRTGGAGLGIYSNGHAALAELGAPIGDLGRAIDRLEMCDDDGRLRNAVDTRSVGLHLGRDCRTVPRRDLLRRIADNLPKGVLRFDSPVRGMDPAAEGASTSAVTVRLDDDSSVTADVVVGADGIHSVVRSALTDLPPARPMGWASWQALTPVPIPSAEGTVARVVQGAEGMCGIMPAGGGLVQWWFDAPWSPDDVVDSPAAMLRDRFGEWTDPEVKVLLERLPDTDLGLYPHYRHQVPRRWGQGAVTLLGDAAHAFPPSTAQGANQALEDSLALTACLGPVDDPSSAPDALRRYEKLRRRPAALASKASSSQFVLRNLPPGPIARTIPERVWTRQFETYLAAVSTVLRGSRRREIPTKA